MLVLSCMGGKAKPIWHKHNLKPLAVHIVPRHCCIVFFAELTDLVIYVGVLTSTKLAQNSTFKNVETPFFGCLQ